jgi:hypothetical protein
MLSPQTIVLGEVISVTFSLKVRLGFTMETSEMVAPWVIGPSMLTTARFQAR